MPRSNRITRCAGFLLILMGTTGLLGWTFDIHVLKAIFGPITMKANAACGLLAAGVALCLITIQSPAARNASAVFATAAGAVGAATLSQHLFGWDLGIDQLLFVEPPGAAATTSPGRMGPNASLSLTLSGAALLYLRSSMPRASVVAQFLGAAVAVLALVPTVGYLYGATQLYAIAQYTGIAMHTGLSLLVLAIGILAARPHEGPVAALMTSAPHGIMARRLLVAALLVPSILGYVRVIGERRGWYDLGLGAALFVVAMIVLLSLTIWRTAHALASTEADLRRAERARDELLERERAAREKAERADRAKDEFIAALSHELRTPLNAILGWMYMLRRGNLPEEARQKAAETVVRNAGLLARLIEDLLDTSRITTGRLTLNREPLNAVAVVRSAMESVLPASEARQVPVVFEAAPDLPDVEGDAQRLQQVVWNLLSNAIKFSRPDHPVVVSARQDGEHVVVAVRDSGEGIDPELLPRIFDRFQQGDSADARSHGGLGLGLYIARYLVELHGGTLDAESDGQGRGAVFTVRIPALAPVAPAAGLPLQAMASPAEPV